MFSGGNISATANAALVFAFVIFTESTVASDHCELDDAIKADALAMDFQTFDQSMTESPWRKLAEDKCYRSAADLIAHYISNKGLPESHNVRILRFHMGQLLALEGDTDKAVEFIERSRWPEQPPQWIIDGNTYKDGTIAFLKRDRRAFDEALETLTEGQKQEGRSDAANVAVLNRLKECWSSDYRSALMGGDCRAQHDD